VGDGVNRGVLVERLLVVVRTRRLQVEDDALERAGEQQLLPNALAKSIVQTDKKGMRALKDGLAEAMGKFVPDRTVLPIPDKAFGGSGGHTFDDSVGDWTILAGPKAPEGAPNVLLVLIDDAGFGQPDTFGVRDQTFAN
jgi:hypothetical protein